MDLKQIDINSFELDNTFYRDSIVSIKKKDIPLRKTQHNDKGKTIKMKKFLKEKNEKQRRKSKKISYHNNVDKNIYKTLPGITIDDVIEDMKINDVETEHRLKKIYDIPKLINLYTVIIVIDILLDK